MIVSDSVGLMWRVVEEKNGKPGDVGQFDDLGTILNTEVSTQTLDGLLSAGLSPNELF